MAGEMMNVKHIPWTELTLLIEKLTDQIKNNIIDAGMGNIDSIYGIPRGGMIVAVALSHKLNLPVVNYPSGTSLIVDDICDSGRTLIPFKDNITATLHWKETAIITPTFHGVIVKDEWIVYPWETTESSKIDGTVLHADMGVSLELNEFFMQSIQKLDKYIQSEDCPEDVITAWHHGVRGYICSLSAKLGLMEEKNAHH